MTTSTDSPTSIGAEHRPGRGMIFVFGSNLAGRHGKSAALHAIRHHGAVYGLGIGPQGRSYRILTTMSRDRGRLDRQSDDFQ